MMFSTFKSSKILLLFPMLVLTLLFPSCASNESIHGNRTTIAKLKEQADQWDLAIIRKDIKAISSNMSGVFRHIGKNGAISNRATFISEIISPDLTIDPYTVEDFDIRIYGDCALLCGRTKMTGSYKGKSFKSHYRYIDTYTLKDGQWKVCNVQITAIPE